LIWLCAKMVCASGADVAGSEFLSGGNLYSAV
jgi:hypothetical protein